MSEERLEPFLIERYRAFAAINLTTLKLVFLVNAGAAIAVLALIANLMQDDLRVSAIFAPVIFIFGIGAVLTVFSAVVVSIAGYGEDFTSGKISLPSRISGLASMIFLFAGPLIFAYGLYELVVTLLSIQDIPAK